MNQKLKNYIMIGLVVLNGSVASLASANPINQEVNCPTITAKDIRNVINNGTISTEQGYTLADEVGETKAQVLIDEPTANPFDTYYQMVAKQDINAKSYWIYIGNILGKAAYEAKERAEKILLTHEEIFKGHYDAESRVCIFKMIDASSDSADYPFKSRYETIVLLAAPDTDKDFISNHMVRTKHRR